jgi:alpha/beta superfamily hydrolase
LCLCHGIPAVAYNPEDRGYAMLAEKFCSQGFVTFTFNFRGAGPSEGNFDLGGWIDDLKFATDFLYSMDEVEISGLVLIGFSGGAAVSVNVAAIDQRISAVAALACPATFDFMPGNKAGAIIAHFRAIGVIRDVNFPLSLEEWFKGFAAVSPIHYIHELSPRPLLIVHGDKDDTVSFEHARKLYDSAGEPKELVIIPGAGHRLRIEVNAINAILKWLSELQMDKYTKQTIDHTTAKDL